MATSNKMSAHFHMHGGVAGGWKKMYFVLDGSKLRFFETDDSSKEEGAFDLTEGRGVRDKSQSKIEWPSEANEELCFGVATKSKTLFVYATDQTPIQDWVRELQKIIESVGKPDKDWEKDVVEKPESKFSKALRSFVAAFTKIFKKAAAESGALSDEQLAAADAAADAVKNQAEADPNTSLKDRAKMGAKDGAGVAGHGLNVASEYIPNQEGQAAVKLVGGVMVDQSEADDDLTPAQRIALAGGSAIEGAAGFAGDIEPLADALEVTGGVVKGQAEADKDANWKERVAIATENVASGVGDLDAVKGNEVAKGATDIVKKGAKEAEKEFKDEREKKEKD